MNRGEIWLAQVGRKQRPVMVLTRNEVLEVRALVTVAEITASPRGLVVEVDLDHDQFGLAKDSAVNCDGLHTIPKTMLTRLVSTADEATMNRVCAAVRHAFGC